MRTAVALLLVLTFVLGSLAWSMDVHIQSPDGSSVVAASYSDNQTADPDTSHIYSEHCGHSAAHFTGIPMTSLAESVSAAQPDWLPRNVVHHSLTYTPPTPPPLA